MPREIPDGDADWRLEFPSEEGKNFLYGALP